MNRLLQTSSGTKVPMPPSTQRIDAHHHLWRYDAEEFGWIDDKMTALRRDFLADELMQEMQSAGIDGTVVVQARESLAETRWLLECARVAPFLRGVVGWAPLDADDLPEILSRFDDAEKLVGFREVVQGKRTGILTVQSSIAGFDTLPNLT